MKLINFNNLFYKEKYKIKFLYNSYHVLVNYNNLFEIINYLNIFIRFKIYNKD